MAKVNHLLTITASLLKLLSLKLRFTLKGLSLSIRKMPQLTFMLRQQQHIYEDYGTCGRNPFCFCKTCPSLPDFCHPDGLGRWQQSVPELEKLAWVSNSCKLNKRLRL